MSAHVIRYSSVKDFTSASKIVGVNLVSSDTLDCTLFDKYCSQDNLDALCSQLYNILNILGNILSVKNESDREVIIYTVVLACIQYIRDETGIKVYGGCRHRLNCRMSSNELNGYPDFMIYRERTRKDGTRKDTIELIIEAKNQSLDTLVKGEGQILLELVALNTVKLTRGTKNFGVVTNANEWWFYTYVESDDGKGIITKTFSNIGKYHLDCSDIDTIKDICKMIICCTLDGM